MDITTQLGNFSCCQQFRSAYSFKRCCYFLLTFVVLVALLFGVAAFIIIVIVKPQKPLFSIQTVKVDSYTLNMESQRDLFVSSVLSLTLNASNPNRVGISYSTSRLHVLIKGLVIGMFKIPRFHQPPGSKNTSVPARVIFECVNLSQFLSQKLMKDENPTSSSSHVRILGDIIAQVRILRVTLPKFRVAMDCDITIDHRYLTFRNEVHSLNAVKNQLISLPMNSQLLSKKCTMALYV